MTKTTIRAYMNEIVEKTGDLLRLREEEVRGRLAIYDGDNNEGHLKYHEIRVKYHNAIAIYFRELEKIIEEYKEEGVE